MSRYTMYYNTRRNMYKIFATRWKNWADEANLTDLEITGAAMFFHQIAKRFGLIKEFKKIGVI